MAAVFEVTFSVNRTGYGSDSITFRIERTKSSRQAINMARRNLNAMPEAPNGKITKALLLAGSVSCKQVEF